MENFVLQMMPFVSGFSITEEKKIMAKNTICRFRNNWLR